MTERERHGVEMAKVGILMGSDSDLEIMSKAAKMLEDFGIDYETVSYTHLTLPTT